MKLNRKLTEVEVVAAAEVVGAEAVVVVAADMVEAEEKGEEIVDRSEEHTSELQSLREISYAVFCLKKNHTRIVFIVGAGLKLAPTQYVQRYYCWDFSKN